MNVNQKLKKRLERGAYEVSDFIKAEIDLSRDVEGRTEFNLREAIAESIRVCGREYTREIVEAELDHV